MAFLPVVPYKMLPACGRVLVPDVQAPVGLPYQGAPTG